MTPDDVKAVARATLAHRIVLHADAEFAGQNAEEVVGRALEQVPVPRAVR